MTPPKRRSSHPRSPSRPQGDNSPRHSQVPREDDLDRPRPLTSQNHQNPPPAAPTRAERSPSAAATSSSTSVAANHSQERIHHGQAVSPGIAIGPILILPLDCTKPARRTLALEEVDSEIQRLERTLEAARVEVATAEEDALARLGPDYAAILAAHARMIADPSLRHKVELLIRRELVDAPFALSSILDEHASRLEQIADPYLAARAADVRDIERRILACFRESKEPVTSPWDNLLEPTIVLANDLSPSQTATLDNQRVLGFVTETGGRASHTAIVAAALEIPAVVGVGGLLEIAQDAQHQAAIIDGDEGILILDPTEATLTRYRALAAQRQARFEGLACLAELPAVTLDGTRHTLLGNIEFPGESAACLERGAEGIGLYRTEFLYLNTDHPPTEEEQYHAYRAVVEAMRGRPVTIRTLDLGADKIASFTKPLEFIERNPFLGLRSVRLSLRDRDLFRTQLRAILRAACHGEVRMLLPMITTLSELREVRALIAEVIAELAAAEVPHRGQIPVGVMIEVPAAALVADHLAGSCDFFSIGTNDLIQYTLAVDRTSPYVAHLYDAADPSVLRLISQVVAAASQRGLEVAVCGAMGGEPLYTILLMGMGVRVFSMPPHQLPEVKRVVRAIGMDFAHHLTQQALRLETAQEIDQLLKATLTNLNSQDSATQTPTPSTPLRSRSARATSPRKSSGSAANPNPSSPRETS